MIVDGYLMLLLYLLEHGTERLHKGAQAFVGPSRTIRRVEKGSAAYGFALVLNELLERVAKAGRPARVAHTARRVFDAVKMCQVIGHPRPERSNLRR